MANLDILEQSFVAAITDQDNPKTYNNATQSYRVIRPHVTVGTAEVQGHRVISRDRVKTAIQEILDQYGCGVQDRVRQLALTLKGEQRRKTTIYRMAKLGDTEDTGAAGGEASRELVVDQVIETEPTFNERNKAADILNRMDGTYATVDAAKQIAVSEYEQLRKRFYKQLRASVCTSDSKDDGQEGTGEVDCGTPE
jgi:hypothetical protein